MKTIHIIFNAHIDPIWLWPWQSGLDECLATCRSACDRLDANPDIIFTRGEAWVYEQIERLDPQLFERIRGHVGAGRWEITGGWYIQPDCNQPSGWGMEKQIAIGKAYFQEKFGQFPTVAYNVDSFGHAATLPGIMRSAGQDSYILTRPGQHERPLPSRLFRWRGYGDGPEVIVCRPDCYVAHVHNLDIGYVRASTDHLPEGCEHTVSFIGVGDHGGGPTEKQIAWCRRHAHDIDGWRMEFSSLTRFFESVRSSGIDLPLVVGELQHHAVGCYSVYRPIKTGVRRAEHLLAQVDSVGADNSDGAIDRAWKRVCFHQFHDTMGGTCIPSAYVVVNDQVGGASAEADEALQYELRRRYSALPDDPMQRIVLLNASDTAYDGYVEYEPWCGPWPTRWSAECMPIDESGNRVHHQVINSESVTHSSLIDKDLPRLVFRLTAQPGELRVLRIKRSSDVRDAERGVTTRSSGSISSTLGVKCKLDRVEWTSTDTDASYSLPLRFDLIRDTSDTWSHDTDRYDDEALESAKWDDPAMVCRGPLLASLVAEGAVGGSALKAEWRVYSGERFADLKLTVDWHEHHRVLKLVLPFESATNERRDGIMGGSLIRTNDGIERPLRDWTLLTGKEAGTLGVVCPDVYALDVTDDRVRITLLRSCLMAHHDPTPPRQADAVYADQGVHVFRFRFFHGSGATQATLDSHAYMMQRPLIIGDLTRGMPTVLPGCEPYLED